MKIVQNKLFTYLINYRTTRFLWIVIITLFCKFRVIEESKNKQKRIVRSSFANNLRIIDTVNITDEKQLKSSSAIFTINMFLLLFF